MMKTIRLTSLFLILAALFFGTCNYQRTEDLSTPHAGDFIIEILGKSSSGLRVQFTASGVTQATELTWDFGDGRDTTVVWPSGGPSVVHVFSKEGMDTVQLTAASFGHSSVPIAHEFVVDFSGAAPFSIGTFPFGSFRQAIELPDGSIVAVGRTTGTPDPLEPFEKYDSRALAVRFDALGKQIGQNLIMTIDNQKSEAIAVFAEADGSVVIFGNYLKAPNHFGVFSIEMDREFHFLRKTDAGLEFKTALYSFARSDSSGQFVGYGLDESNGWPTFYFFDAAFGATPKTAIPDSGNSASILFAKKGGGLILPLTIPMSTEIEFLQFYENGEVKSRPPFLSGGPLANNPIVTASESSKGEIWVGGGGPDLSTGAINLAVGRASSDGSAWALPLLKPLGNYRYLASVAAANDGGCLIAGSRGSNGEFAYSKIKETGGLDWEHSFSGTSNARAYSILEMKSGAVLVAGGKAGRPILIKARPDGTTN